MDWQAVEQQTIMSGGNKAELLAQLSDIGRVRPVRPTFWLQVSYVHSSMADIGVLVNGISAEDGSGNCWIVEGYEPHTNQKFLAFYNSKTREGWIKFA